MRPTRSHERCPSCGAAGPLPILFGLPTTELSEAADRGEVWLGGCDAVGWARPDRHCTTCGHEWRRADLPGRR